MSVKITLGLAIAAALLGAVPAFAGPSITVQTGYADGERGGTNRFPNPWSGDIGTDVFAGTLPGAGNYDAGAIRVINNTDTNIVINALTVDGLSDGASYTIWSAFLPATVTPGHWAIFTQTNGENFDTSDNAGGFTPSNPSPAKAQIRLTINGLDNTVTDAGQRLNTGGFDFVLLANQNENLGWADAASVCNLLDPVCQTNQPVPEPISLAVLGFGLAGLGALRRRA